MEIDAANRWGETALHLCAGAAHSAEALALLRAGANVDLCDQWERTAAAVAHEHREPTLAALLEAHARGEHVGEDEAGECGKEEAEQHAERQQRVQLRSFVLAKLMEAPLSDARFGSWLAHAEIDVNASDYYGMSPLHKLAAWNKPALVHALAAHRRFDRAQLTRASGDGAAPLHLALLTHSLASAHALLAVADDAERRCMLAQENADGCRPLQLAHAMQLDDDKLLAALELDDQ